MNLKMDLLGRFTKKNESALIESIGDLKNKMASGLRLSVEEKTAVSNFERYKANVLNSEKDEKKFENKHKQLHVIATLGDWREFLKEMYF